MRKNRKYTRKNLTLRELDNTYLGKIALLELEIVEQMQIGQVIIIVHD
jgi:hypothetical protein